jgi:transposase
VSLRQLRVGSCDRSGVELTDDQVTELRAVASSRDVSGAVATRARIVLWTAEGRMRKDVGELAGVSLPTVDRWLARYADLGLTGLEEHKRGAPREQMPAHIPARILALTRTTPPVETGLSHWSSREMAAYVTRTERVPVSWHYVAKLWRENNLKPHRQGTFKLSRDPRFADKVFDVVGLYLDPPAGAVVLSFRQEARPEQLQVMQTGSRDTRRRPWSPRCQRDVASASRGGRCCGRRRRAGSLRRSTPPAGWPVGPLWTGRPGSGEPSGDRTSR